MSRAVRLFYCHWLALAVLLFALLPDSEELCILCGLGLALLDSEAL
jgi:hypothetical protein